MTENRDEEESVGPALFLTLLGGAIVGIELLFGLKTPTPLATVTVVREPGSEEESGSGMSSLVGPGRTPKNWRNGPNIFGG